MRASRSADMPTDSGATEGKPCAPDPTAVNKAMPNTRLNAMRFALIGSSFAIENAYRLNEPIGLPSSSSGTEERQRSNLLPSLLPLRPPVQKSQVQCRYGDGIRQVVGTLKVPGSIIASARQPYPL